MARNRIWVLSRDVSRWNISQVGLVGLPFAKKIYPYFGVSIRVRQRSWVKPYL